MTKGNREVRELPKGWLLTKLGQVCEVVRGGSPRPMGDPKYFSGSIPFIKIADITKIKGKTIFDAETKVNEEGSKKSRLLPRGSLILSNSGTVCIPKFLGAEACIHDGFVSFLGLPNEISKEFLFYYFQYLRPYVVQKHKQGITQVNLNIEIVSDFDLELPPTNEQNRIVEKIEELFSDVDQGVESLKTAQKQLKVYRQAVLKWAFEGKLTEEWRKRQSTLKTGEALLAQIKAERENRYQQQLADWERAVKEWEAIGKVGKKPTKPSKPKELMPLTQLELAELPELPIGWCWASVEQLGYVQLGRQRSPQNRSKDFPTKYIRAANITENGFDLTDVLDMEFKPHEFQQYQLKSGDILLSEASGSPEQVGKPAVWRNQIPNCCFQNTVIRFRPTYLSSEYFLLIFKNLYSNGIFSNIASGVGINHLSANKFSAIPIPLAPLEEQEQIVQEIESRLSICDQLEATLIENLQKAEALRQSILKQAFEGKLVPQDPNDEPAETLLEQIRAEKSVNKNPSRKPRKTQDAQIQLDLATDN